MAGWIIGGITVFLLWLFACMLLLAYLTVPLSLAFAAVGCVAGIVAFTRAVVAVLLNRDDNAYVVTPDDVLLGAVGGRTEGTLPIRDNAWPTYFATQTGHDLRAAWRRSGDWNSQLWQWAVGERERGLRWLYLLAFWPLTLPMAAGLIAFTAGMVATGVTISAILTATALAARLVGTALAIIMRSADRIYQYVFRSATTCPHDGCYLVNRLPAFTCPSCGQIHRDLRPSRLGVLWHRCQCGKALPTTRVRAGIRLRPVCQRCMRDLADGAGRHTDVTIPVFGATSSGKTSFIMAALGSLSAAVDATGRTTLEPADDDSAAALRDYDADLNGGAGTPATPVTLPKAVTVRVTGSGARGVGCLMHIFDAAGEYTQNSELGDDLAYLDTARTIVYVLDPFAIPAVRDEAHNVDPSLLDRANPSLHDPESAYAITVGRLRAHHVKTHRRHLAVVVSKADVLARLPVAQALHPEHTSVRTWLVRQDLGNLIRMADIDFRSVRYFLVASKADAPARDTDALAPLSWLARVDGVGLPSATNGVLR